MRQILKRWTFRIILAGIIIAVAAATFYVMRLRSRPDSVLASIGNQYITTDDFERELVLLLGSEQFSKALLTMSAEGKRAILEQMITRLAFVEAARQNGVELDEQTRFLLERLEDDKRAQAYIQGAMEENPITESQMRGYYETHPEEFTTPEMVRLRHIVVTDKTLAEQLLTRLKQGENMGELAGEYNIDGTRERGGDLGWVRQGIMVPAFEKAAFALDTGEVSGVVSTSFGYHIIKVEDRKQAERITFEDAKKDIRERLAAEQVDALGAQLREKYPVRINEELWTSFIEEHPALSELRCTTNPITPYSFQFEAESTFQETPITTRLNSARAGMRKNE